MARPTPRRLEGIHHRPARVGRSSRRAPMAGLEAAAPGRWGLLIGGQRQGRATRGASEVLFPLDELAINGPVSAFAARLPLHSMRPFARPPMPCGGASPRYWFIIESCLPGLHQPGGRGRCAARAPDIPIVDTYRRPYGRGGPGRAAAMRHYVRPRAGAVPFEPRRTAARGPALHLTWVIQSPKSCGHSAKPAGGGSRAALRSLVLVLPGSRGGEDGHHLATFGAEVGIARDRLGAAESCCRPPAYGRSGAPRHCGMVGSFCVGLRGTETGRVPAGRRRSGFRHGALANCASPACRHPAHYKVTLLEETESPRSA